MAEYYGDRFSGKPGLIIPARRSFAWRDLVGQGSSLYTKSLKFENASFERDKDAYMLSNGVFRKFDIDIPAIDEIDGRQCAQITDLYSTFNPYSEQLSNLFSTQFNYSEWSATLSTDPLGNLTAEKLCETDDDSVHSVSGYLTGLSGTSLFAIKAKAEERTEFSIRTDGQDPSGYVRMLYNLDTQSASIDAGSPIASGILPLNDDWFLCYYLYYDLGINCGRWLSLMKNGSFSYQGAAGEGMYFCHLNYLEANYLIPYIYAGSTPGSNATDKLQWSEAQVAAESWVRDRFAIAVYPNYSSDQIDGFKIVFAFRDSVEDIYGYFDSSARFNIAGSVSGTLLQTDPLTWEALKKLVIAIEADNGSNCKATIFGANGAGEVTGTVFSTSNGPLELGMLNELYYFDGKLSEPYRYFNELYHFDGELS